MRFALWDHCGKGAYLHQQMLAAGHEAAPTLADAELLLIDCDWAWAHPRPELIKAAAESGARIVLYPHGGLPTTFVYDGLTKPDPLVDLRLEHGQASIDAADQLGLELHQEAPGWLYGPTAPFQSVADPVKVLFAPQHPNMEMLLNGTNGHDPGPKANQAVYQALIQSGFKITVSVVGPLWKNGIYPHPNVTLISNHQMLFAVGLQLVAEADVVIGAGTMAACGVALGKPTIMVGQGHYADYLNGRYVQPDHLEIYDDLFRYPLDANEGDLEDLIGRACAGDHDATEWRERHIGDDGTKASVELIGGLAGATASSSSNVIMEGVTAISGAAPGQEEGE